MPFTEHPHNVLSTLILIFSNDCPIELAAWAEGAHVCLPEGALEERGRVLATAPPSGAHRLRLGAFPSASNGARATRPPHRLRLGHRAGVGRIRTGVPAYLQKETNSDPRGRLNASHLSQTARPFQQMPTTLNESSWVHFGPKRQPSASGARKSIQVKKRSVRPSGPNSGVCARGTHSCAHRRRAAGPPPKLSQCRADRFGTHFTAEPPAQVRRWADAARLLEVVVALERLLSRRPTHLLGALHLILRVASPKATASGNSVNTTECPTRGLKRRLSKGT